MIPLTLEEIVAATEGGPYAEPGREPHIPRCNVTRVTTDSRDVRPGDLFVAIRGENHDGHDFVADAINAGAVGAIVRHTFKPPFDADDSRLLIRVGNPVEALGRLARYHRRQFAGDVIAVTGSIGKTTTKEMIAHVLAGRRPGRASPKSFNNQIGVPLTLLSAQRGDVFLVAEVGSNTPGEVAALAALVEPELAVVTGVAPVHLEQLHSLEGIAREKLSLLQSVRPGGCAIVNIDNEFLRAELAAMRRRGSAGGLRDDIKLVTIGSHPDADLRLTAVGTLAPGEGADGDKAAGGIEFQVNDKFVYRLGVPGEHNAFNALAAVAVGRRFGMTDVEIAERLAPGAGFALPPMRLQRCRGGADGNIAIILDAYNANPASVAAAIDVLCAHPVPNGGRRVAVLGEMRELGSHAGPLHHEIAERAAAAGIDMMVAVGAHAKRMAAAARDWHKQRPGSRPMEIHTAIDTASATRRIAKLCRPGDLVLIKGSRAVALERVAEALMSKDAGNGN